MKYASFAVAEMFDYILSDPAREQPSTDFKYFFPDQNHNDINYSNNFSTNNRYEGIMIEVLTTQYDHSTK